MKKIERKWPIGTADNEVVIKETDLDELEQQRNEFCQLFIQVTRRIEKDVVTFEEEIGEVPERFLKIYKNYTKTLERITGKSWEEIKEGMTDIQAFPRPFSMADGRNEAQEGMTLRDYFAGQALITAVDKTYNKPSPETAQLIAETCYLLADAMLKERDK